MNHKTIYTICDRCGFNVLSTYLRNDAWICRDCLTHLLKEEEGITLEKEVSNGKENNSDQRKV